MTQHRCGNDNTCLPKSLNKFIAINKNNKWQSFHLRRVQQSKFGGVTSILQKLERSLNFFQSCTVIH
uniref:Uncharacterized protein n=1 Tax=Anguilla anguilla TaxID=7936 RepID=A0A0E9UXN0_ANGAN